MIIIKTTILLSLFSNYLGILRIEKIVNASIIHLEKNRETCKILESLWNANKERRKKGTFLSEKFASNDTAVGALEKKAQRWSICAASFWHKALLSRLSSSTRAQGQTLLRMCLEISLAAFLVWEMALDDNSASTPRSCCGAFLYFGSASWLLLFLMTNCNWLFPISSLR